jgi:hypothetical protein
LAAAATIGSAGSAVDSEIASLRGHRHTAYNLGEPVRPDARCRSAGAGVLYEGGRPVTGWEVGRYDCDGRVVVTLEREAEPQFGKPRMRIVDVLTVPGAGFRRAAGKRHIAWTVDDGICDRRGQAPSSLVVTMRWNARDEASSGDGVVRAWRFNTQRERIEPVSTRGIACFNPVP